MCPAKIETVIRLCQRIIEEQDPESLFSLVLELNSVLSAEQGDDVSSGQKNQIH